MDFYDVHGELVLVNSDWSSFFKETISFTDRRVSYTRAQQINGHGVIEVSTVFMWGASLRKIGNRVYLFETAIKKYGFDFDNINCDWTVISRYCSWEQASKNHASLCDGIFPTATMTILEDVRNSCPLCGLKEKKEITIET